MTVMRIPIRLLGIGAAAAAALLAAPANASAAAAPAHPAPGPAAVAPAPAAGVSPNACVAPFVEARSNIRTGASRSSGLLATTTGCATTNSGIICFTRGERVTAGGYTTDVWYRFFDLHDPSGFVVQNGWTWGGNAITPNHVDPDPLYPHC